MTTKKKAISLIQNPHIDIYDEPECFYANLFGDLPRSLKIELSTPKAAERYLNLIKDEMGAKVLYSSYQAVRTGRKDLINLYLVDYKRKIMIGTFSYHNEFPVLIYSDKTKQADFDHYLALTKGLRKKPPRKKPKGRIHVLTMRRAGKSEAMRFVPFKLDKFDLSIEDNYTDDFLPKHETLVARLSKDNDNGIAVLYGDAGTGKTYYIRHLCKVLKKKILYVPPAMVSAIVSPSFIQLLEKNKNSILLIEDADNILRKRDEMTDSQDVSSILNLADGMLTDVLKIQIVATFNTKLSSIDSAFLRKGRLIIQHEFKQLPKAKAQHLSDKLGHKTKIKAPMILTDIYNQDEPDMREPEKNKIGFQK